jgi:hypothetical protein
MNERVEELAGQAFQFAADNADETGKGQLGIFAEKFAELMVAEFQTILRNNTGADTGTLSYRVEDHFRS